ncbi:hypothetical protein F8388_011339 [Cannabis sativa]|uniref:PGG domain-containing protein n=1 Tax=Cannabis sativa TaxID=3483 RepID=A0A7J6EVQ2_CANSA|nr:hypothetical protein F8388_011339 [Cannabis sativa]
MEIMMLKPSFAKKLNLDGFTPLHLALQNRPQTTEMVNRLVRVDTDLVRVRGREGKTPLHCVAEEGNLEFLKMFLSLCPLSIQDVTVNNETALFVAVRNGRPEAFEILVQGLCSARRRGYKISSKILMKCNDDETNNVLHIAALTNQPQVLKIVFSYFYGIKINAKNRNGLTALDIANGQIHVNNRQVKNLLQNRWKVFPRILNGFSDYFRTRYITEERRNLLLVVAVLIVTVTYQAALSPPGGVWQGDLNFNMSKITDNNSAQIPGKTVMSNMKFVTFYWVNTLIFL